MKKRTPKFDLRLPEVSSRTVWAGIYTEMFGSIVMLFREKPAKDKILGDYNSLSPEWIGSIYIDDWISWLGTVKPFLEAKMIEDRGEIGYVSIPHLDCRKVIEIEISMAWDEHGMPIGLDVAADN